MCFLFVPKVVSVETLEVEGRRLSPDVCLEVM